MKFFTKRKPLQKKENFNFEEEHYYYKSLAKKHIALLLKDTRTEEELRKAEQNAILRRNQLEELAKEEMPEPNTIQYCKIHKHNLFKITVVHKNKHIGLAKQMEKNRSKLKYIYYASYGFSCGYNTLSDVKEAIKYTVTRLNNLTASEAYDEIWETPDIVSVLTEIKFINKAIEENQFERNAELNYLKNERLYYKL